MFSLQLETYKSKCCPLVPPSPLKLPTFEYKYRTNDVYVHAGQHESGGTCDMGDAKQTFLFSGTVELSAHRICLAVEVVPMHCQLTKEFKDLIRPSRYLKAL